VFPDKKMLSVAAVVCGVRYAWSVGNHFSGGCVNKNSLVDGYEE
jgi:hypothetical protein